jgi:hypothetical protein
MHSPFLLDWTVLGEPMQWASGSRHTIHRQFEMAKKVMTSFLTVCLRVEVFCLIPHLIYVLRDDIKLFLIPLSVGFFKVCCRTYLS